MHKLLASIPDVVFTFLLGLVPGAIGATVSLAVEKNLTWAQRFLQLGVGIVIAFYVGRFCSAAYTMIYPGNELHAFILDGIKFVFGMIAFKATPRFIGAAVDAIATIPARLVARFVGKDS